MNLYESVFITRQDLTADIIDSLSEKFCEIVKKDKGKIISKEYWGLRNLSYKINKNSKGHYFSINIQCGNEAIVEIRRVAGIDENIVRSNIFKVDEHSKDKTSFAISVDAKSYKATDPKKDGRSEERKVMDALIEKVVINS